jgi:SAM-dependent methyltransferase
VRDWVLDHATPKSGETVLDVGCGDGLIAFEALERVGEQGMVIFSDISQDLLDRCRVLAAEIGVLDRRSSTSAAIAWGVLHKVLNDYCPHHATGVGCPAWAIAHAASFGSVESAVQRSGIRAVGRIPTPAQASSRSLRADRAWPGRRRRHVRGSGPSRRG